MSHQYLVYAAPKQNELNSRVIAQELCNNYFNLNFSVTKLRRIPRQQINCKDFSSGKTWVSIPISYEIIHSYIEKHRRFDSTVFNLFEVKCEWLDGDTNLALPQQVIGSDGGTVKLHLPLSLGSSFPIQPMIDSEGVLYNSFQSSLTKRVIELQSRLVANSNDFQEGDWLYDLITLFSNAISLVDITLNQLHIKAEYAPLSTWTFDPNEVGNRINRRMDDKFLWVKQITGHPLDNVEQEMRAFKLLKDLRNHTQHFDPPCFGFTLQEATGWLNLVPKIGSLLLKIRKKLSSKPNESLIRLSLLPEILFTGITTFDRKRVVSTGLGYESTKWK